MRTWRRRVLIAIAAVIVGIAGAWLAMRAFGRDTVPLGPFTVDLDAGFGAGGTTVALPPLGEVRVNTHDVPLHLSATLTDVDVERLSKDLEGRSAKGVASRIASDARDRLGPFGLRTFAVAVSGGIIAGAVVFRRRWRWVTVAATAAAVAVGSSAVVAGRTYRTEAFAEPTFVGTLRLAPQLLGPARELTEQIDDFRENFGRIVGGAVRAYTALEPQSVGGGDELRVLHISDVHLNPLGIDFAVQIARGFDIDLVLDTGDLTSYGTPLDEQFVSQIRKFRRPYVFVRGNHDPPSVADLVERAPGGHALDGRAARVEGLRIFGAPHPVFTEDQRQDVDSEDLAQGARDAADSLARAVAELDHVPDVVAVHDDRMTGSLAGRVPLVVSGHFHRARASVVDGTLFLRAGSTGGAGVNMFSRPAPVPLSASILYLERGRRPHLVAYDLIEQSPATGRLTISRHLAGDIPEDVEAPASVPP
jgi:predicted phosphodiesterase